MNRMAAVAVSFLVLVPGGYAAAQVAGSTTVGVAVEEMKAVALGWSVKRQILGQAVYNEQKQRVGKIDDLIIAPDTAVSFVIVGAGGFVEMKNRSDSLRIASLGWPCGSISSVCIEHSLTTEAVHGPLSLKPASDCLSNLVGTVLLHEVKAFIAVPLSETRLCVCRRAQMR